MSPQISLSFSVPETNLILEALGNLPYVRVCDLITRIHQQAEPQLAAETALPRPALVDGVGA
ncbi:hypothetical protein [Acrocarpospora catenulata]|uniref:hypothetical protein n=1 Tax=Acrocarpospora catenulata TaxID=2836182 RepID=UPI001BDA442F|nr:hypothetical protein [Acrocarpospora catenulata]